MSVLDNLLFNLKTISSIPKETRIKTSTDFITFDEETALQFYRRWRDGESRYKAVKDICHEIRTIIEISSRIMESKFLNNAHDSPIFKEKRINELKLIAASLEASIGGIDNLCETYVNDQNVRGPLEPLIKEIITHISEIKSLLSHA